MSLARMAGPIMVAAMLRALQDFIDLKWVGGLGTDAVAAISMGGTVIMILFPVIMGLSTGTIAIISRATGAGRHDEAADTAGQSLSVGLIIGLAIAVPGYLLAHPILRSLGATPAVEELGAGYLQIYFVFGFSLFMMLMATSIFQGVGNANIPTVASVVATVMNAILDPVFIYGSWGVPAMGVRGAAVAAVVSQLAATIILLWMIHRGRAGFNLPLHRFRPQRDLIERILRIGLPSSGQLLIRNIVSLILMAFVARHGTAAVAAYGIGIKFHMTMLMPAFVLGNAVSPIVGQNLGASQPDRAHRAAWLAVGVDILIKIVIAALLFAFAPALIHFFDPNPDVVAEGARYLRIVSPFMLFAGLAIVLGRALQGAGDTMFPMIATGICLWLIQLPLAMILPNFLPVPASGIWWAISIATVVHGIMIVIWFQTGRWKHVKV